MTMHAESENKCKTAQVALSTFFNIMKAWRVQETEQRILLGQPAESTFHSWKIGKETTLPGETLERISFILGIYKALAILLPVKAQADAWPSKPNDAFAGETALEYMLNGALVHLSDVRSYLDAQVCD